MPCDHLWEVDAVMGVGRFGWTMKVWDCLNCPAIQVEMIPPEGDD